MVVAICCTQHTLHYAAPYRTIQNRCSICYQRLVYVCNLINAFILQPLEQQAGPPGTGKSTTVYHVIQSCVQPGRKTLVTCARNQAIDAIVDKLGPLNPLVSDSPH
jgi:hypothetical protein